MIQLLLSLGPWLRSTFSVLALLAAIAGLSRYTDAGTYHAYAPPNVFGDWTTVATHAGALRFSISVAPVGSTRVVSEVKYFAPDGHERISRFYGRIEIATCNCVGSIQVRSMGIPFGSGLDITCNP
jgi:hypothetical protein